MASITFDGATRIFDADAAPAVDSLNLDIADGEFLVLVGPSGCGKSTSLRMLAGLEPVDRGRILIGGRDATAVAPRDRDVAMVFQNYALYPNMTVEQNMSFALRNRKTDKRIIAERVKEAARILQLEPYLDRKPAALSGGQRQRVAMGRAIVREPAVFCMDEPLSNLDAKLRVSTRGEISALQRRLGTTTVYVTHDQVEAMTMGDRVAVLEGGVLQQVGTPEELYDRPVNAFVAGFLGSPSMNLFDATVAGGGASVDGAGVVELPEHLRAAAGADGREVVVGVRSEDLVPDPAGSIELDVTHVEELGPEAIVYGRLAHAPEESRSIAVRVPRGHGHRGGDGIRVRAERDRLHLFDAATGERVEAPARA
ncbi:ABC transporter ATP-binding protein [Corynebacterium sp. 335C]